MMDKDTIINRDNITELLIETARQGADLQGDDGSMPAGRNGPWNHRQTPVRNTAHWSILFSFVHDLTSVEKFRKSACMCLDYLLRENLRPHGKSFKHRIGDEIDGCNGLIGQAWTLEGLIISGELLNKNKAQEIAQEVFRLHPFSFRQGLWKPVETDGSILPVHGVINQQIWFAAIGSIIGAEGSDQAKHSVEMFMDKLERNIDIYPSGLIKHTGCQHYNRIKRAAWRISTQDSEKVRILSEGYHSFNLYGLAILRQNFPNHSFWNSETFYSIVEYTKSIKYKQAVNKNVFAYGYNPTGLEVTYFLKSLRDEYQEEISYWYQEQMNKTKHTQKETMRVGSDPETLMARTYEIVRLLDRENIE